MTHLSVNINKFATLRNSRGGNNPNIVKTAVDCQRFGANGITVHPRPDERHIRYQDVWNILPVIKTELNIEGYPDAKWMELVLQIKPAQATLVPDPPNTLTSNIGWDTIKYQGFLEEIVQTLRQNGIRTSIFVSPIPLMIEGAGKVGTDRIELYTGPYAHDFELDPEAAVQDYVYCSEMAKDLGMEINAGHDLDLKNLMYLKQEIPFLAEVSIGHALICDALYLGLENTIQLYKRQLQS